MGIPIHILFIIYIIYDKFITFLSYFDHDRKYPNSKIVTNDSYEIYGQHCELSSFGSPGYQTYFFQ